MDEDGSKKHVLILTTPTSNTKNCENYIVVKMHGINLNFISPKNLIQSFSSVHIIIKKKA